MICFHVFPSIYREKIVAWFNEKTIWKTNCRSDGPLVFEICGCNASTSATEREVELLAWNWPLRRRCWLWSPWEAKRLQDVFKRCTKTSRQRSHDSEHQIVALCCVIGVIFDRPTCQNWGHSQKRPEQCRTVKIMRSHVLNVPGMIMRWAIFGSNAVWCVEKMPQMPMSHAEQLVTHKVQLVKFATVWVTKANPFLIGPLLNLCSSFICDRICIILYKKARHEVLTSVCYADVCCVPTLFPVLAENRRQLSAASAAALMRERAMTLEREEDLHLFAAKYSKLFFL